MKHHYIITGILGRVSGKPASQLFLIARHTHNWAFYRAVQIPALSCNIHKDCVFLFAYEAWLRHWPHRGLHAAPCTRTQHQPVLVIQMQPVGPQHRVPAEHQSLMDLREGSPLFEDALCPVNITRGQPSVTTNATAASGCCDLAIIIGISNCGV